MTRRESLATLSLASLLRASSIEDALAAAQVPSAFYFEVAKGKPPRWTLYNTTPKSIFAAASLSKQFTAYAVLRESRIDLDRPLEEAPTITPRHLLSHSSGWPNWRFEKGQTLVASPTPGRQFRYSGEGYVRLQALLEKVSGQPFALYMRENVFAPLGLQQASFAWDLRGPRAAPHDRSGQPLSFRAKQIAAWEEWCTKERLAPEQLSVADQARLLEALEQPRLPNWYPINAAASLEICAEDYARFLAAALQELRFREGFTPILSTPRAKLSWGLGWGVESHGSRHYLWQWGDNSGYKNFVWLDLSRQTAHAVFTNGDKGRAVYQQILRGKIGWEPLAFSWLG